MHGIIVPDRLTRSCNVNDLKLGWIKLHIPLFLPLLKDITLTTFSFFTFALAGCLQSFHPTHAQLSNRNGKFVFSGTFHIMWVEVGQGILLNRSIFLNKSDQLCINITLKGI